MSSDKPYLLPDPRVRPASFLTIVYKTMKSIEFDDRAWDKLYFARCNKRTTELLEILQGNVEVAVRCMQDLKERFENDNLSWTIETIVQYSFEWKAEHSKKTDRDCMRRFLGEFTKDDRIGQLKRPDLIGLLDKIKTLPEPTEKPMLEAGE